MEEKEKNNRLDELHGLSCTSCCCRVQKFFKFASLQLSSDDYIWIEWIGSVGLDRVDWTDE
jgi:hypothetical protein